MKTLRSALAAALAAATLLALRPDPASAVPVFARKYGLNCTNCHSGFPRLNDWGQRFRANGYRLPGRENEEKTVLESPPPFALRTSAGYTHERFQNVPGSTYRSGFRVHGLDVLSAGVLAPHVSYLMVYPPQLADSARGVEGQVGTIEMASVVFSDLGSPWLNLRAGRFEPAYAAFSVKRHLTITPYEVYDYAFPGGSPFSETQEGLEVTGSGRRFAYAAGLVNGSATNRPGDGPADVYARAAMVIGAGEGQTAGQRVGVTGYFGRARPEAGPNDSTLGELKCYSRFGVDASLNLKQVNLAAQWLYGQDPKALWSPDLADDVCWSGFFAELSWQPLVECVAFARYDLVNGPGGIDPKDITRLTGGGRYYFADNLALHVECSRRTSETARLGDRIEDLATARLDFGF
jgi:hypothetical protein